MLKILEDIDDKGLITVGFVELMKEDWALLIPALKKKIQKFGRIHWYFEMEDFRSVPKNIQPLDDLLLTTV